MANILVANAQLYGKAEKVEALIEELEKYVYIEGVFIDNNSSVCILDCRWSIDNTLNKPEVLALFNKYDVALEASGLEGGVGFFEIFSINRYGEVIANESFDASFGGVYFDPDYDKREEDCE